MSMREPVSHGKFVIYEKPAGINYGKNNIHDILKEINFRLRKKHKTELKKISRPLYGKNLIGFVQGEILKMVQMIPTQIYVEVWYADLKGGGRLYVQEGDNNDQVFISMLESYDKQGFDDLIGMI